MTITQLGDEIVAANNLYGGTYQQLNNMFRKLGRKTNLWILPNLTNLKKLLPARPGFICGDIGNPKLDVPDFEKLAAIAHEQEFPLL